MKRKFLSILTALVLALSLLSATALAAGEATSITTNTTWNEPTTLTEDLMVSSDVTLTLNGQITIEGDVTISGGGTILRGSGYTGQLFQVGSGSTLTLNGITIDGGYNWEDKAGQTAGKAMIVVSDGGKLVMQGESFLQNNYNANVSGGVASTLFGGAVGVETGGTFQMSGGTIQNNYANHGGAVDSFGTFTMTGGTITGNTANSRAGGVHNRNEFTASNATISGNTSGSGGGVYSYSSFKMTSCKILNNTASQGGGIYVQRNTGVPVDEVQVTLTSCTISGNTATGKYGGGIWCNATLTAANCTISGNKSTNQGGGVYGAGNFTISGGTISENTSNAGGGIYIYTSGNNPGGGTLLVKDSAQITGNTATGSSGGGICAWDYNELTIEDGCTVSNNTAGNAGGGVYCNGAAAVMGTVTGNTAADGQASDFQNTKAYVAQIGNMKYTSVQAAIEAADDSDTVTILSGTHSREDSSENADNYIIVDKAITIEGQGNRESILENYVFAVESSDGGDADRNGTGPQHIMNVTFKNLSFTGTSQILLGFIEKQNSVYDEILTTTVTVDNCYSELTYTSEVVRYVPNSSTREDYTQEGQLIFLRAGVHVNLDLTIKNSTLINASDIPSRTSSAIVRGNGTLIKNVTIENNIIGSEENPCSGYAFKFARRTDDAKITISGNTIYGAANEGETFYALDLWQSGRNPQDNLQVQMLDNDIILIGEGDAMSALIEDTVRYTDGTDKYGDNSPGLIVADGNTVNDESRDDVQNETMTTEDHAGPIPTAEVKIEDEAGTATYYPTLQDAIQDARQEETTITLLQDVTLGGTEGDDNTKEIPSNVTLVVNPNVTLTVTEGAANNGNIINNGTIIGEDNFSEGSIGNVTAVVTFNTTPGTATVTVEDVEPADESGKVFHLTSGTYSYTVSASGYQTQTGAIEVNNQSQTVEVSLAPASSSSSSPTRYTVSVPSDVEGGTVSVSPSRASRGQTVTVTVTPDEGFELDTLTVTDADGSKLTLTDAGNGKYTFTMPRGAVSVAASFKAAEEEPQPSGFPFTDVTSGDWYYDAVVYAWENELMTGTSATTFAPGMTTSRAMLATLLYRLEGASDLSSEILGYPYADVEADSWYGDGVYWARLHGVVTGVTSEIFNPNGDITREQMAAMLYRYAQYKGYDVTGSADLSGYADAASVSGWAQYAMQWAVDSGLISGVGNSTLNPQGSATRAEIATILMRFVATFVPAE